LLGLLGVWVVEKDVAVTYPIPIIYAAKTRNFPWVGLLSAIIESLLHVVMRDI
jgi:hypothetical protein